MAIDVMLCDAANDHNVDAARSLIRAGADVNATDEFGMTPILLATRHDYPQEGGDLDAMIDFLINNGANINAVASDGWTPLHFAVNYLSRDLMARLINAGAEVTLRNSDGRMPIHIALDHGRIDDVRFLADFYDEKDIDIFIASMIGRVDRVAQILDGSPMQANITDAYGSTPLMEAVGHDQIAVTTLLLDRGAQPNVQNEGGITALHLATIPRIIENLLAHGADPTIQDIKGLIPPGVPNAT